VVRSEELTFSFTVYVKEEIEFSLVVILPSAVCKSVVVAYLLVKAFEAATAEATLANPAPVDTTFIILESSTLFLVNSKNDALSSAPASSSLEIRFKSDSEVKNLSSVKLLRASIWSCVRPPS